MKNSGKIWYLGLDGEKLFCYNYIISDKYIRFSWEANDIKNVCAGKSMEKITTIEELVVLGLYKFED